MQAWVKWLIGVVVVLVVAVVAVPWVYINFIEDDPPARLQISDEPTTTTVAGTTDTTGAPAPAELAGTWNLTDASEVGYRVDEVLFGQDNTVVGRTKEVTGDITLTDTAVTKGEFTVDMKTVTTDDGRRDGQFNGRIMNTAEFPTATFTLTKPIEFGTPKDGEKINTSATGDLTLHGVTKSVTFDVEARKTGDVIEVSGAIPIVFADYEIPSPSRPGITVKDHGELEFLLVFNPA